MFVWVQAKKAAESLEIAVEQGKTKAIAKVLSIIIIAVVIIIIIIIVVVVIITNMIAITTTITNLCLT